MSSGGLELDQRANETCEADADVAVPASAACILVIAAREDLAIMRETRRLLISTDESQGIESARPAR
jgi:acetate kinase